MRLACALLLLVGARAAGVAPAETLASAVPAEKKNPIDAVEVQQSLSAFLKTVDDDAGFVAQLSFHNCHIPFVGAAATVAACRDGDGCLPENRQGQPKNNYSAAQLDFYACLLELDAAVGAVLRDLRDFKRYDDTLVYFTTDNGPEGDCPRGTHIFNPTSMCA